jgi:hypothetical protein
MHLQVFILILPFSMPFVRFDFKLMKGAAYRLNNAALMTLSLIFSLLCLMMCFYLGYLIRLHILLCK